MKQRIFFTALHKFVKFTNHSYTYFTPMTIYFDKGKLQNLNIKVENEVCHCVRPRALTKWYKVSIHHHYSLTHLFKKLHDFELINTVEYEETLHLLKCHKQTELCKKII